MKKIDKDRFKKIYTELLVGLVPREEQLMGVGIYFKALMHFPVEYVEQAGRQILSHAGQKFLPTVGEWAEVAGRLERGNLMTTTAPALQASNSGESPQYYCDECHDTGWRYNKDKFDNASGLIVSSVSRCPCPMRNPVLNAQRVRALDRSEGRKR